MYIGGTLGGHWVPFLYIDLWNPLSSITIPLLLLPPDCTG